MSEFSLSEINDRIAIESKFIEPLKSSIGEVIVGQDDLINKILIGLLANGHILLEGVPGLAKTLMVNTLAKAIDTNFHF
jgi:MoxR-like ATPase